MHDFSICVDLCVKIYDIILDEGWLQTAIHQADCGNVKNKTHKMLSLLLTLKI